MKKIFLKKAEKMLLDRKQELLSKNNKDVDIDIEGDEVDAIQGKQIAMIATQLNLREKERLERVERALTKIKEGTFGTCDECEEQIEEKRLLANPEFHICISCAEQNERDAKLRRSRGVR